MPITSYEVSGNGKAVIVKDPDAVLDYGIDLTGWLAQTGSTLASVQAIPAGGVTCQGDPYIVDGKVVMVMVAGGQAGVPASVTFRFTTDGVPARTDDRTIYFKIRER